MTTASLWNPEAITTTPIIQYFGGTGVIAEDLHKSSDSQARVQFQGCLQLLQWNFDLKCRTA